MSKRFEFNTPPMVSISPAAIKMLRQKPQKTRFVSRLSTPSQPILLQSPKLSPIQSGSNSIRSLLFDSEKKNKDKRNQLPKPPLFLGGASPASPLEKSFTAPLNDHLDLEIVLKEFQLAHLLPVFQSNGITLLELSEMKEKDFVDLGVFKLNELDKLKRVCSMLNDSQNTSY